MKLQSPIKPNNFSHVVQITQTFGENALDYSKLGMIGHNGIDFSTSHCKDGHCEIYAAHDGVVISDKALQSDTAGRYVKLLSDETEINGRACKIESCYFHLKEARVSCGDPISASWFNWGRRLVRAGALIGISDNTGQFTTGPHLHFHIRVYWKKPDGSFMPDKSNGFDSCIDPMPYFRDDFVMQYPSSLNTGQFWANGVKITEKMATKLLNKKV